MWGKSLRFFTLGFILVEFLFTSLSVCYIHMTLIIFIFSFIEFNRVSRCLIRVSRFASVFFCRARAHLSVCTREARDRRNATRALKMFLVFARYLIKTTNFIIFFTPTFIYIYISTHMVYKVTIKAKLGFVLHKKNIRLMYSRKNKTTNSIINTYNELNLMRNINECNRWMKKQMIIDESVRNCFCWTQDDV